jgi:gliding motility-associated-like protein
VYVRDVNNCVLTASAIVAAPAALSLLNPQVFAPSCSSAAGNDGRIVVAAVQGGTPPYQFSLDGVNFQSNGNFSNLSSGLYTLVVRDATGCTGSQVLTVPAPVSLQFQVQQIQAATCGQSNGALEVLNVTGGSGTYFYSLDGQSYQSSPVFSNIPANIYTVYVRDATLPDCVFRRTMVVDGTLALGFEATAQNIACGASAGSILVENIQGGTLPYQLVLSQNGGQTREVTIFANQHRFEGLEEGVYILRVQDQSACAVQPRTLIIQKANALRARAEASLSLVEEPTGTIFISELSGGFAPYQLSIDGGQSFVSFSGQDTLLIGLGIGTYRVLIRDGFQCQWTKEVAVLESTFLIPNIMTPNKDGKNDYFRIRNLPSQGASLRISNRWGKVVYSSNNYQNDWDGGDNPDGVYYYTIQVPEMGTFSGWIQIWR